MRKTGKRLAGALLALVMVLGMIPGTVRTAEATQSRAENFSRNYSLTGKAAQDIVNVAAAQVGKTQSNLGYTEGWCADFVCDCARLAEISGSIIPYNYASAGGVGYLYNYMLNNCGATVVSTPQKGDLVFYYCTTDKAYCHVAIMSDSTSSIHGNIWNPSSQVYSMNYNSYLDSYYDSTGGKCWTATFVRPKYVSIPTYTVSFNANGGNGVPASQTKTDGVALTLSTTRPTRSGYIFKGWANTAGATTAQFQPGGTYNGNANATLYAVWEKEPDPVTLANISIAAVPTKTIYLLGEALDTAGLTLTATYSDGSTQTITSGFAVSGFDSATAGDKTVTVTYEGKMDTFNVTVREPQEGDWVGVDQVPEGAEIVSRKWTYDHHITSDKAEVDGYTLYNTTSVWNDWGAWSGWSKTAVSGSDSRQVETKTVTDQAAYTEYTYYYYRYWNTDAGMYYYTYGSGMGGTKYTKTLTSPMAKYNVYDGYQSYKKSDGGYYNYSGEIWFLESSRNVAAKTHTEYRYRDRSLVYTYYLTREVTVYEPIEESESITNVRELVQYRKAQPASPDEDQFAYTVSNEKATITGYNGAGGDVTIPDTLGGYPVTAIGADAFRDCTSLTSVTIPDSVTNIVYEAFWGCTNLTAVTMGSGVTTIGVSAFRGCTNLTTVTIPAGVTGIGSYAFYGSTGLTDVYYSGSAEEWGAISIASNNAPLTNATIHYAAHEHSYTAAVTAPTCTEGGYTTYTCTICGDSYTADYTAALGHAWGAWVYNNDATYEHDGTETRTCAHDPSHTETRVAEGTKLTIGDDPEPIDPDAATIFSMGVTGRPGEMVTLPVSVKNNPGVAYTKLKISYAEELALVSASNMSLLEGTFTTSKTVDTKPYVVMWTNTDDSTGDGGILELTFRISDEAEAGDYAVTILCDEAYNGDFDDVSFNVEDMAVTVKVFDYGDVNDDGEINGKDAILLARHLAEWDVTLNLDAADVNADGQVNGKDAILLARYLAEWDVTLGA